MSVGGVVSSPCSTRETLHKIVFSIAESEKLPIVDHFFETTGLKRGDLDSQIEGIFAECGYIPPLDYPVSEILNDLLYVLYQFRELNGGEKVFNIARTVLLLCNAKQSSTRLQDILYPEALAEIG